jgi:hypothetical protein
VSTVSPRRRRIALAIAIAADALQLVFLPFFPAIQVVDDGIDAVVAIVMIALLGWHWGFLPSFLTKLVPVVEILPTWTAAVWLVTRGKKPAAPHEPSPAEPSPPKLP